MNIPSAERIRDLFDYDPSTGVFFRRARPRSDFSSDHAFKSYQGQWDGKPTGARPNKVGYLTIRVAGQLLNAHRVAWLFKTGSWPIGQIDHINGDKQDNRLSNLRVVSAAANKQNLHRPNVKNKLGVQGVHLNRSGKFVAQVSLNSKPAYREQFDTAEAAGLAYIEAKRRLHQWSTL